MENLDKLQSSYDIFDQSLLNLYDQQFNYDGFKTLIKNKSNDCKKNFK